MIFSWHEKRGLALESAGRCRGIVGTRDGGYLNSSELLPSDPNMIMPMCLEGSIGCWKQPGLWNSSDLDLNLRSSVTWVRHSQFEPQVSHLGCELNTGIVGSIGGDVLETSYTVESNGMLPLGASTWRLPEPHVHQSSVTRMSFTS